MKLGLFRTGRATSPPGVDKELWNAVKRVMRAPYEGPTENEPEFVRPYIAKLTADLTRLHHEDPDLAEAHRELDEALLEFRLAKNHEHSVEAETALRIRAGRSARHNLGDRTNAPHLRADGARASAELDAARKRRSAAEQRAEARNVALQTTTGVVDDRMLVVAREAMPRVHEFVALLNAELTRSGRRPLPNIPADLAEQLVLEARRRAGEPDPELTRSKETNEP